MAPVDAQRLQPHQIIIGLDGQQWVNYNRAKSKVGAYVPLLTPAIEILEKHQQKRVAQNRDTTFPFVSNQVLNRNIKIIGEICELGFTLNFYVSRYTFATTVTLFQGVAITTIKRMMGHRKIESTLHYAIPDKPVIDADMNKVQQTCNQLL